MAARSRMFWGPLTRFGLVAAAIACVLDQASKLWLLKVFDLADKGVVKVTPFVDLVLTWNTGISYGWFQQEGPFGQGALLALKVVAVALLWIWLARASSRLSAVVARADHRRGDRQRHRPPGLRRGGRFRAAARRNRHLALQLVRL